MGHSTLCGAVQSKFWGETQCIYIGPYSEVHYLRANKNGYCSRHQHEHKWNRFFLISGAMRVTIYREHGEDVTELKAGQFTDVPPGVYHRFDVVEDSECLEVYWVDALNPADIKREDSGGMRNENTEKDSGYPREIRIAEIAEQGDSPFKELQNPNRRSLPEGQKDCHGGWHTSCCE